MKNKKQARKNNNTKLIQKRKTKANFYQGKKE